MKIKLLPKENFITGPQRNHYNDAGADVLSTINVEIKPHETVKIPLGYGFELPDGFQAIVQPRSSYASKGIVTQIAPIDSGYTGEVHAIITNTSDFNFTILVGDKVGQIVVMPIVLAEFTTDLGNERGSKGFGSSGK